ncbi:hypothetical protein [uncultured Tateyamaria sp.]|uniref:hypothetical protein n=1 Tax=uncultured Tateyamaria sp. TaxID=455651 RepID=UPI002633062C|nr:hypothetical protein [uncultured Tateyamaria sp.]
MNKSLKDDPTVEARLAQLQRQVDQLQQPRRRSILGRVLRTAGVLLLASGLGIGALTAAGVEALRIDEQGNVHILGAVTIGGPATVASLVSSGAVSGSDLTATDSISSNRVTASGTVSAETVTAKNIGATEDVAANSVTATTVTGTNVTAGGALTGATASISGVTVDANGNVAVPGNFRVAGESNRISYTSKVMGDTTPIDAATLASFCGDGDGCEVRMAMLNYDTVKSAPAALVTWLYCDATCDYWRTSTQLLGESLGARALGKDQNNVVNHVLYQPGWSCYFTDGEYTASQGTDVQRGFGLLVWVEYPGSDCAITIID